MGLPEQGVGSTVAQPEQEPSLLAKVKRAAKSEGKKEPIDARAAEDMADRQQQRLLRGDVSRLVFRTLWCELAFFGAVVTLQGFKPYSFELNQWVFGFMVNGVLVQTIVLVHYIVKHLFPGGVKQGPPQGRG